MRNLLNNGQVNKELKIFKKLLCIVSQEIKSLKKLYNLLFNGLLLKKNKNKKKELKNKHKIEKIKY